MSEKEAKGEHFGVLVGRDDSLLLRSSSSSEARSSDERFCRSCFGRFFFGFYAHMSKTDRFYDRNRSYKIWPIFR